MTRISKLTRILGVSLGIAFGPVAVWAQTSTTTTTTPTITTPTTTSNTTTSNTQSTSTNGQGTNVATQAQNQALTQKITAIAASSGTGSATSIPSNTNAFANNMVIPQSLGLPTPYATSFGPQNVISTTGGPKGKFTYLYVAPPTAATTTTPTQTPTGFTTYGTPRAPVYTTHLSDDLPPVAHQTGSLYVAAKDIVETSSRFKDRVKVILEGDTLVLAGVVSTPNERILAEGIVRTAPGVNGMAIRNELVVAEKK